MPWHEYLNRALEAVWGLEAPPRDPGVVVRIPRPWGFVVAERRLRPRPGEWLAYWVFKEWVPTLTVARRLASAIGAVEYRVLGLKDSKAVAYQYVFLRGGEPRGYVEGRGWRAWLLGPWEPPGLGGHQWNNFRLTLEVVEGDAGRVCRALQAGLAPGYYGPQRFGVRRPNSHLQGLLLLLGARGLLLSEMAHEYPMGGGPGGYEARSLRVAQSLGDPLAAPWGAPKGLLVEAVQSYVWNRALSRALREGLEGYAERRSRTPCPRQGLVLLARLPSRSLLYQETPWAGLVASILEEEGIPPWVLPARAPYRPLAVEPCRLSCLPEEEGVVVWTSLPRGIYATSLVRGAVWVDWLFS